MLVIICESRGRHIELVDLIQANDILLDRALSSFGELVELMLTLDISCPICLSLIRVVVHMVESLPESLISLCQVMQVLRSLWVSPR